MLVKANGGYGAQRHGQAVLQIKMARQRMAERVGQVNINQTDGKTGNTRAPGHAFTYELLGALPIPKALDTKKIGTLVSRYRKALGKLGPLEMVDDEVLNRLLLAIDAEVLRSYDLPPRLERRLLEYFRGRKRPVPHEFVEWVPETFTACIPLHEYIAGDYKTNAGPWVLDVFTPAPAEEADALAAFLE